MISNKELIEYLLENRVDENGDLDLNFLDFSNFSGDVYISNLKVKNKLTINKQRARFIYQDYQIADEYIEQGNQKAKVIFQEHLQVGLKIINGDILIDPDIERDLCR